MFKANLQGKSIPFVQAHHIGRRQRPKAIVLRTSFTTGDKGAALGIANTWHNPYNRMDSCHYVVDEALVFRCVPDKIEAKAMPHPELWRGSISINVCYDPSDGDPSDTVIHRTAQLVARLCKLYKIEPRILSYVDGLKWQKYKWRSPKGIILKTVGDFPADKFLDSVLTEYKAL